MRFRAVHLITSAMLAAVSCAGTLPGGYATTEAGKDVMAAAEFAVKQQSNAASELSTLVRVLQAEQQVVAGMNYRLLLIVKRAGVERKARAIVFRDLNSQFFLKSWEWLND